MRYFVSLRFCITSTVDQSWDLLFSVFFAIIVDNPSRCCPVDQLPTTVEFVGNLVT